MRMNDKKRPVIGITMGDPVGIGPEIIHFALNNQRVYKICRPLVIGDARILEAVKDYTSSKLEIRNIIDPAQGEYDFGGIDVLSRTDLGMTEWGRPTALTGQAMIDYIESAIDMAVIGKIKAVVTCPINKVAMKMAGSKFHGHTELFARRTGTDKYVMMLAGDRLRVVLVTIHTALKNIPLLLTVDNIVKTVEITSYSLMKRFGIKNPRVAVAGLNPHAGEDGMFGDEEEKVIVPAIDILKRAGFNVKGPFPPDTVFYNALNGYFDVVVCMYHDQGLIPFKMIHFKDGVNTTLGLPIIRTSVDHGTAYDLAGKGKADPGSLIAAIEMAVMQTLCSDIKTEGDNR